MNTSFRLRLFVTSCCLTFCFAGWAPAQETAAKNEQNQSSGKIAADQESDSQEEISPLITAGELQKLIDSKPADLKVLEPGTSSRTYSQGHLPDAMFLHWVNDMTDLANAEKYNKPDAETFTKLMSKLGIRNSDRVVIYDRFTSRLSTRLFWTLKFYGHEKVQILNGGFAAWHSKSLKLTTDSPAVVQSDYKVTTTQEEIFAAMELVETQRKQADVRLVDGRPAAQFSGAEPGKVFHTNKAHARKGHIPGAANVFWQDNFNADGTFKSAVELRKLYKDVNIEKDNRVITYCNEGLHAAPPWFVLTQLLEFKDVRLYDSSMAEWSQSTNPMAIKDGKK